jgi:hypothetical protein
MNFEEKLIYADLIKQYKINKESAKNPIKSPLKPNLIGQKIHRQKSPSSLKSIERRLEAQSPSKSNLIERQSETKSPSKSNLIEPETPSKSNLIERQLEPETEARPKSKTNKQKKISNIYYKYRAERTKAGPYKRYVKSLSDYYTNCLNNIHADSLLKLLKIMNENIYDF